MNFSCSCPLEFWSFGMEDESLLCVDDDVISVGRLYFSS